MRKRNDPKSFWKTINQSPSKEHEINIDLNTLSEHFKELNTKTTGNDVLEQIELERLLNSTENNEIINNPFTELEINNALHALKNNKATGIDLIPIK